MSTVSFREGAPLDSSPVALPPLLWYLKCVCTVALNNWKVGSLLYVTSHNDELAGKAKVRNILWFCVFILHLFHYAETCLLPGGEIIAHLIKLPGYGSRGRWSTTTGWKWWRGNGKDQLPPRNRTQIPVLVEHLPLLPSGQLNMYIICVVNLLSIAPPLMKRCCWSTPNRGSYGTYRWSAKCETLKHSCSFWFPIIH